MSDKIDDTITSRKWLLVLFVFWTSFAAFLLPPLISVWLMGAKTPFIIMSASEFVTLTTLAISAYFGANVFQKHIEIKNGVTTLENNIEETDDPGSLEDVGKEA